MVWLRNLISSTLNSRAHGGAELQRELEGPPIRQKDDSEGLSGDLLASLRRGFGHK